MDAKALSRRFGRILLAILEPVFKYCGVVAAVITLGTKGSYTEKFVSGISSLPAFFMKFGEIYQHLVEMGTTLSETSPVAYNLTEVYGASTVEGLLVSLNGLVLFPGTINQNFAEAPFITLGASISVFLTFFLVAVISGFFRRGGQDKFWSQVEKELWNRFFADYVLARKKRKAQAIVSKKAENKRKETFSNKEKNTAESEKTEKKNLSQPQPVVVNKKQEERKSVNNEKVPSVSSATSQISDSEDEAKSNEVSERDEKELDLDLQVDRHVKEYNDNENSDSEKELEEIKVDIDVGENGPSRQPSLNGEDLVDIKIENNNKKPVSQNKINENEDAVAEFEDSSEKTAVEQDDEATTSPSKNKNKKKMQLIKSSSDEEEEKDEKQSVLENAQAETTSSKPKRRVQKKHSLEEYLKLARS